LAPEIDAQDIRPAR